MSQVADVNFCLPYPFTLFQNPSARRTEEFHSTGWTAISAADIRTARAEISAWPGYKPTSLYRLSGLANATGVSEIWYKDEGERFGLRSFKSLGGAYALFRTLQSHIEAAIGKTPESAEMRAGKYKELTRNFTATTATDGNYGRSVAWGAKLFGCRSVIYIPSQCSQDRQKAIEGYGAEVRRTDVGYDETLRLCMADAKREGRTVISDTSWEGYREIPAVVMQGYTVISGEVIEQLNDKPPTHVFVQAGCGGLAGAACAHFWQHWGNNRPRFIVVEPEGADCLYASARAGKLTAASGKTHTVMAGLDCEEPSPLAWDLLSRGTDFFLTISDETAAACMKLLAMPPYHDPLIVAGESAVAGLAGLLCVAGNSEARKTLGLTPESRVLLFGTEGDTDPSIYKGIVGCSGDQVRKRAAKLKSSNGAA